jgi:AAHS family 4-hydroxybenzoate transporter-like MFS transporter
MSKTIIDVSRLIDDQKVGSFTITLVSLSFAVMMTDGYDMIAAAYAAPALISDWHIKPAELGRVFSANPLGMVLGAPLLGWLGDRYGRRLTVILATLIFSLFTLLCALATSVNELMILRLITGIGLGGMLPNITALNVEFAPKGARATLVVLMFMGMTAGGTLPALVVAAVPAASWQTIYYVGGILPLLLAVLLYFWLPESIKYLSLKEGRKARAKLERTLLRVRPDLSLTPETVFISSEIKRAAVPVAELFQDGLKWITLLLWLVFVANLTANYFLYSWMPVLFRADGFSSAQAALTTACYYVGGMAGGLTVSRFIDGRGLKPVVMFFAVAVVAVACIGIPGLPAAAVTAMVFLAGFCVLGVQLGINAASGLIYPTRMRATGTGWAFGMGRLGGIGGPMLGAWLISLQLSTSELFFAPAVPLTIGGLACFVLVRLCRIRFHGDQLSDVAFTAHSAMAAPASAMLTELIPIRSDSDPHGIPKPAA